MESFEEIRQVNAALSHCSELKTQLNSALIYIQRLNAKYNQTDYNAVIRNLENYRSRNQLASPYSKPSPRNDHSIEQNMGNCSTPVKSSERATKRRLKLKTSTPNRSAITPIETTPKFIDGSTPKRSMRELKENNNKVTINTIKVQRDIESIITKLQVVQREQLRMQRLKMEQSIYQSSANSLSSIFDQSFSNSSFTSNCSYQSHYHNTPTSNSRRSIGDESTRVLQRLQHQYATPLKNMHRRLTHLNASLISTY